MAAGAAVPGRRILITGAASGIGAWTARRLAAPGARMALHTRASKTGLDAVARDCRQSGAEVETFLGDLGAEGLAERLTAEMLAALGGLDILVANAGFSDRTPIGELGTAAYDASHRAIARAFFLMARTALPALKDSSAARVIAVGSFVAHRFGAAGETFPASAAAKAAMEAMAKALAAELAPSGGTVNVVLPGYIEKETMKVSAEARARREAAIPLRRHGAPAEVAALIAFLASADAAYITGQCIGIDGGLSL
ncbi:MAG: SDR family oxidoreductase [Alphaproteobacteria bacterium]|nr:SDR family oxidoreductase [Alphaproteobacteria bacterium]